MVTWAQHLASQDRHWSVDVRIEGLGASLTAGQLALADGDARFRWCVDGRPAYAAGQPGALWIDALTAVPDVLAESLESFGGVPEFGAVTVRIGDVDDVLSTLITTDANPRTYLVTDLDEGDLTMTVGSAAGLVIGDLLYLGAECLRITGVSSNTLDITRAYAGTAATPHYRLDRVFDTTPFIVGRRLDLTVAPWNADSTADEQVLGDGGYVIDGITWDECSNVWVFSATSVLRFLDQVVPQRPRTFTLVGYDADRGRLELEGPDSALTLAQWSYGYSSDADNNPPIDAFLQTADGEIIGVRVGNGSDTQAFVSQRALLGTEAGDLELGSVLRQVFVAGDPDDHLPSSFRYSPSGGTDVVLTEDFTRSANMVDLMLCVMTSPADDFGAVRQFENVAPGYPNWSVLPAGYGLGIPVDLIDLDSFLAVRRRPSVDALTFPFFVLGGRERGSSGGDATVSGAALFTEHFLKVTGAYLSLDSGLIRLVLPRLPLAGEATVVLNHDDWLTEETEPHTYAPSVQVKLSSGGQASQVKYLVGPQSVPVTFTAADFESTYGLRGRYGNGDKTVEVSVPSGDPRQADVFGVFAQRRLWRTHKPQLMLGGDVEIGTAWDSPSGSLVSVTLAGLPNLATGVRGWSSVTCVVERREHRLADDAEGTRGDATRLDLVSYGPNVRIGRIAPCAVITNVVGSEVTVAANRYTCSDAPDGLPDQDCNAFEINDQVYLMNLDGTFTTNGTTPETVGTITPGANTISLGGTFSGDLATGLVLVVPHYADSVTRQTARYAYAADRATETIGATSVTADRFGED